MIQAADSAVLLLIQDYIRCDLLDPLMLFCSYIGNGGMVWILTGLALLIHPRTRKGGLLVLISLLAGYLINNLLIKNLVCRPRPYTRLPELISLLGEVSEWSFPSGHTCSSFAAATAMALAFGKRGAWAYLPAALIALSRIYVGVHYPTDILAGALVGSAMAFMVFRLLQELHLIKKE